MVSINKLIIMKSISSKYTIEEVNQEKWSYYWSKVSHHNLVQSWEYGEAKNTAESWTPIRFLVRDNKDNPVAILQVLTKTWPLIGGIARLNRGPLLIKNNEVTIELEYKIKIDILQLLISILKKYKWWVLFVAPELTNKKYLRKKLMAIGLSYRKTPNFGSALLSLDGTEDEILMSTKPKWRGRLRKAKKYNIRVECTSTGYQHLDDILNDYVSFQKQKGFAGIPNELIRGLSRLEGKNWKFIVYNAMFSEGDNKLKSYAGTVISIIHGDTAFYLVGFTNQLGRQTNANYLLLWSAILDARDNGCRWFDVGGLNTTTTKGVSHFKRGLNGDEYILQGELWCSAFPAFNKFLIQ